MYHVEVMVNKGVWRRRWATREWLQANLASVRVVHRVLQ